MKSLKQEAEELAGYGYWTPQYGSFLRRESELKNKVFSFIEKIFFSQGCLPSSTYMYLVWDAIYEGKFIFSSFKKNKYSSEDILKMYKK
jgi:hypothetical protein